MASQGLTRLQEGFPQQGTVGGGDGNQYYEFFNPPGRAQPIQVREGLDVDSPVVVGGVI